MKIKNTIVIVKLENNKFHQVMLTPKQESLVLGLVMQFDDVLKVGFELDGIELKKTNDQISQSINKLAK